MKYTVVGDFAVATKKGIVMPGEDLDTKDLEEGTVIDALVSGGHLKKVVTHTRKKSAE